MKINFKQGLLVILLAITFNTTLSAQKKIEQPKNVLVELRDGNSINGILKGRQGDTVVVESTILGTLNLNIKNIKSITAIDATQLKNGIYWFENTHATRGFFAPTSFNLRKGEGYYSNIFLFLNSAAYGFTDNFTIGVGGDAFTIVTGNAPTLLYITPKFSFRGGENFTYGVGALIGSFGFNADRTTLGVAYGTGTLGNRNNNVSIGLGYGFSEDGWSERPVVTLSGQWRVARKVSLMTENYILPEVTFGVTGARFMNSNFSFDIGLMYGALFGDAFGGDTASGIFPIPFLGIALPFGHKKI